MTMFEAHQRLKAHILPALPGAWITLEPRLTSDSASDVFTCRIYVSDSVASERSVNVMGYATWHSAFHEAARRIKETWGIDVTGPCLATAMADADASAQQIGGATP